MSLATLATMAHDLGLSVTSLRATIDAAWQAGNREVAFVKIGGVAHYDFEAVRSVVRAERLASVQVTDSSAPKIARALARVASGDAARAERDERRARKRKEGKARKRNEAAKKKELPAGIPCPAGQFP